MTEVLNSLSLETLEDLYFHENPEARGEKKKLKKKEIVDALSDKIDTYAIEVFVASLPLAHLKTLAEKKVEFKESDNKNSRSVLSRRLTELIVSTGFDEFLDESVDADQLKVVAEDFDVKADKKAVSEAARTYAAERYFTNFDVESLRVLADDLKLKEAAKTSSKRKLVEAIVTQEDAEAPEPAPKKKKQKKADVGKKKALEKGITYDEIFQHYYVEELRDFVKAKGIKVSGKKPVLIKRILAFLAGETEGIMAGDKVEKKKKSSAAKKGKGKGKGKAEGEGKTATATKGKGKAKAETKAEEENGNGDE
jgi:hypothetical protein